MRLPNLSGAVGPSLVRGQAGPVPGLAYGMLNSRGIAAVVAISLSSCASLAVVDPHVDDGTAAFAAACVGVLAAERAYVERGGGIFSVAQHRALSEWMFRASDRRNLLDDEIGRAAERRRWAEGLPAHARSQRLRACDLPEVLEFGQQVDLPKSSLSHERRQPQLL